MSRIAILTDIHSNLQALEAVLAEARERKIERFACLGDVVGYNAFPRECLDIVRSLDGPVVLGNHDEFVSQGSKMLEMVERHPAARTNPVWAGIYHSILELGLETCESLAELPFEIESDGATFAHASLHAHGEWPYLLKQRDAMPTLNRLKTPVGFFGHTHHPAVFSHPDFPEAQRMERDLIQLDPAGKVAVVVGSVGQPRDGDTASQWAIYDSKALTVRMMKTPYDAEAAARAVEDAGLPHHSALRLLLGH